MGGMNVMQSEMLSEVAGLISSEGYFLDHAMWDEWLDLFTEDCEYWMPSWDSDTKLITNPRRKCR